MTDFIDRAKLEALANERSPHLSGISRFLAVETFMAGVDATLALLDAETTEEWGVRGASHVGVPAVTMSTRTHAERFASKPDGDVVVSRRVLYGPWLPSEGGEKP